MTALAVRPSKAWPTKPLGELLTFLTSGSRGWAQYYAGKGDLFLRIQNVGRNKMLLDDVAFVAAPESAESRRTKVKAGDVLLSITADLGRTAVVPDGLGDAYINQHLAILRLKGVDPNFVSAFLSSPGGQSQILGRNRQGVKAGLNFDDINSFRIPLPPVDEQQRIAEVLDRAEALRAKRRAALAQLDTLRDSLFLDFHEHTKHHSTEAAIAELAEPTRGSFVNGPFGSDLLTTELTSVGIPVVYIRDIRDREYRRVSTVCVNEAKAAALAVCAVRPGDVLVAKVGDPPGLAASYPNGAPPAIVTQDVVRIRLANDRALPEYVVAYLNSVLGQRRVAGITIEATRARFSLGDFKRLRITVPPVCEQREFVAQIAALDGLRAAHRRSLTELDALFASLQHRAFRGEL